MENFFFQQTLDDLIKTLRQQPISESSIISKALTSIRQELKSTDLQTKSIALEKLTYLNSLHSIDISFASFPIIELTSSPKFSHKRIAYFGASQSFHLHTEVLLLITNQLRKDLCSVNEFEVSLALDCLSNICTPDLARDLVHEVFLLLTSSKTFVRKKAIGVVLRVFEKYPDSVRVCFKRLVENLENGDDAIVSAVVGVFCELCRNDAQTYLPLAPEFYKILVESKNNWVLIKVIKIFAKLGLLEPRLAKRIVDPICDHMRRTTAKSLLVECIRIAVGCLSEYETAVRLAVDKIRELVNDEDPNLKYLGLKALLVLGEKQLWAVIENKEVVIKSLSDEDPNIKHASLQLVMEMVSEDNVVEISRILLNYALKADPDFCNEILSSILSTCGKNFYQVIVDFDWYVSLLGEIARNPHCHKGAEIEHQLVDIGQRVKEVRPELVRVARDFLIDPALLGNPFLHRILSAAAWVSGEYVEFSNNPFELIEALLQPRTNLLPPMMRAVYIQSTFKVLVFCLHLFLLRKQDVSSSALDGLAQVRSGTDMEKEIPEGLALTKREDSSLSFDCEQDEESRPRGDIGENGGDDIFTHAQATTFAHNPFTQESIVGLINQIKMALGPLSGSDEVEVQERARNVLGLVELLQRESSGWLIEKEVSIEGGEFPSSKMIEMLHSAFSEEIGPVLMTSQERVPVPEGLVLNGNLDDLESICGDIVSSPSSSFSKGNRLFGESYGNSSLNLQNREELDPSTESTSLLAEHRKRHGLYYLPTEKNESAANDYPPPNDLHSIDDINDGTRDLLKVTEKSLSTRKKSNYSKPRPVVVKLAEGDERTVSAVKPLKDSEQEELSGAVRNILLGEEGNRSLRSKPSDKSSGKRRVKEVLLNNEQTSQSSEKLNDVAPGAGASSSRRSKHHSHGKEKEKSPTNNDDNIQKDKKKSRRHSRNKTRQRADLPLNVVAQSPVIPDFLL